MMLRDEVDADDWVDETSAGASQAPQEILDEAHRAVAFQRRLRAQRRSAWFKAATESASKGEARIAPEQANGTNVGGRE